MIFQRIGRQLLVSIRCDQHLLFQLDTLFSALGSNKSLYAHNHTFFKNAVVAYLVIILWVVDRRRLITQTHPVHGNAITARYVFIRHGMEFFSELPVPQTWFQQLCIALYLLVGGGIQPALLIVRLGGTNP